MNTIQISGILESITTRKDGTLKLIFGTQEIKDHSSIANLFSLVHAYGYCLFSPQKIKEEDVKIPEFVPEFKSDKTPSQRLRSCLYVLYEQQKPDIDFDSWYKQKMEKIIEFVKEKLD